ncbi:hypothetical protein SELMODRAFT_444448 [Selaginella moellendorffii]|uniref:Uncharacterized protein SPL1-2 n=1 Tax=Selaginella moellendorffii TaxID=88036 RepID=D8SAN4_SELML|nr:uncharacterized protein LOC9647480 [Selaginella moellendorffii]EFJ18627.1 hypothetical protein SELMODRAFT_444448 [Selaginella moellendorffii]|eukprot:XP_002980367.1 uncharacterized protein LOC9647480 [Selaginella moellendorffii]
MAALVVRSSDHDKVLSGLGHHGSAHFTADKVVSRISRGGGGDEPSSSLLQGARGRSRKSKNGPKKQPQRGLGVAQLEKLRLQEESKQESACLASLGLVPLPSGYGFLDQDVYPLLSSTPRHHHHHPHHIKGILGFGSGYRGSSSGSPDHRNGGFSPGGCDPSVEPSPLEILVQQHEVARMVATSKSSPLVPALVAPPPRAPPDKNAGGLMAAAMMRVAASSSSSRNEDAMVVKQQQQQQRKAGGEHHPLGVNSGQLFDASLPPGSLPMPRDCRELSMVGIPKELSSFQTNFPGHQVWPSMHNASVEKQRPCVVISLDHGEIHSNSSQSETADNILKPGAHYTPRSISNALGKSSLPFLKADAIKQQPSCIGAAPGFDNLVKSEHHPTDSSTSSVSSMPFLRKRVAAACYLDSTSCSAAKKALVSSGADFLALSLSISHSDVESSGRSLICSANTNASPAAAQQQQQRSSLSLQETLTDVEDGSSSQKSPSSYGNSFTDVSTIEEVEHSITVSHRQDNRHHHQHHRRRCSSAQDVDLNLKLAI